MCEKMEQTPAAAAAAIPAPEETAARQEISFDQFEAVQMTVVKVKACEAVKKSKKLLCFQLDDGSGTDRQILSGIAAWYTPEELVGRQVVCCVNLPPMHIGSAKSEVRILGTDSAQGVVLLQPQQPVQNGDKVF